PEQQRDELRPRFQQHPLVLASPSTADESGRFQTEPPALLFALVRVPVAPDDIHRCSMLRPGPPRTIGPRVACAWPPENPPCDRSRADADVAPGSLAASSPEADAALGSLPPRAASTERGPARGLYFGTHRA